MAGQRAQQLAASADFRLRLRHFGLSRNPEAPMRLPQ
jgi:hypothetical protein